MISGEKILVTGPAGRIAWHIVRKLVETNEVWGIARFSNPDEQREMEAMGVKTCKVDLATCEFGDLPRDFTYVLHIAANFENGSYDRAIQVNAESAGLVLEHCRSAKAALIMSTMSVYKPTRDPWHAFKEGDALGDALVPIPESYSIAKICEEAVARYCARLFNLPVTIARMGTAYGPRGGLPLMHLDALLNDRVIELRGDPLPYSLIHGDDIADMIEPLLGAASVPATIVNFGGDEAVSAQQWIAYLGELVGVTPKVVVKPSPGASVGVVGDAAKRFGLTGPCKIGWQQGLRRVIDELHPGLIKEDAA
jgi:nucleoside-diphosphate-sugar epimerase